MTMIRFLIPWATGALELAGIAAILFGAISATISAARRVLARRVTWPLSPPSATSECLD